MKINFSISSVFLRNKLSFLREKLVVDNILVENEVAKIRLPHKKRSKWLHNPINSLTKKIQKKKVISVDREVRFTPVKSVRIYQTKKSSISLQNWFQRILLFIAIMSMIILLFVFSPQVYYHFFPAQTITYQTEESGTALGGDFEEGAKEQMVERYQPEKDESLPKGDWLIIPRIGVRSEMMMTQSSDEALAEGIWWVPDFGKPGDDLPIILVAHRYGYQWWWKTDYWKYNSFYLLPDLEPGDVVEIVSDQRKWMYEIYQAEEGEQITDYSANLILYTCKYLNSPVKHFRYARLIDPTVDTQD